MENIAACVAVKPDATVQVMRHWSGVTWLPAMPVELYAAVEFVAVKSFAAENVTVGLVRMETGNLKIA